MTQQEMIDIDRYLTENYLDNKDGDYFDNLCELWETMLKISMYKCACYMPDKYVKDGRCEDCGNKDQWELKK